MTIVYKSSGIERQTYVIKNLHIFAPNTPKKKKREFNFQKTKNRFFFFCKYLMNGVCIQLNALVIYELHVDCESI